MREVQPTSVVHLAFVIDPQRSGVLDVDRMWRINVAGTARVMEAITEVHRECRGRNSTVHFSEQRLSLWLRPGRSSDGGRTPMRPHAALRDPQKKKAIWWVQQRAPSLRGCDVFILRPHIFAGASVENYLLGAFRGTPNGKGAYAARMRQSAKRLPCMLPFGQKYLDNKIQFIHVDDMARLIAWILKARDGVAAADHS